MMSKTTVQSGTDIFESMLGDIDYSDNSEAGKLFPFKVRCGLAKRRPPRHIFFEPILNMGEKDIDRVMNHLPFEKKTPIDLTFVFPERWMGVKEQVDFMYALATHPEIKSIRCVDIITSSPMIIGNFMREQIRILTWADDPE
jgi:hypothetical protein